MPMYTISGRFYARRDDWQVFHKQHDALTPDQAREWALSEIGSCHGIQRRNIRIDTIAEVLPE